MNEPYETTDPAVVATLAGEHVDRTAVETTALAARSLGMRTVLAHRATGGRLTYQELVGRLRSGAPLPDLDVEWAFGLARVMALQTGDRDDVALAARLVERLPTHLLKARQVALWARMLHALDDHRGCATVLRRRFRNGIPYAEYLRTDLLNPWTGGPFADRARWSRSFGALFTAHGLEAPEVVPGDDAPFDRLHVPHVRPVADGPLVTVIMTTWRPTVPRILTSLRSVLAQSWRNLEVLVVDDASGPEYDTLLDDLAGIDARVRVLRQPENGGTYLARNRALDEARGEFVTGQDDDDWSHPRRIERQLAPILADPEQVVATRASTLMADPDLRLDRIGQPILGHLAPSYTARTSLLREVGGYLHARKGADTELMRRVERVTDRPLVDLVEPLAVYRITSSSLSRGEFGPGWHHPARAAFWAAGDRAHERIRAEGLPPREAHRLVAVPHRYRVERGTTRRYDVVLAGDWRDRGGGPQDPVLDEIRGLVGTGRRVGIMHLPDLRRPQRRRIRIHPVVQDLVNVGVVDRVLLDDDVSVGTVLVLGAGILQLPPFGERRVAVGSTVVLADELPLVPGRDGTLVTYSVHDCDRNARSLFGSEPTWVARSRTIHRGLEPLLGADRLDPQVVPPAVDTETWRLPARRRTSPRPVVGRRARDRWEWPHDPADLRSAYPVDGTLDVRVLGAAHAALHRMGHLVTPPAWAVARERTSDLRLWLAGIDVYLHHPARGLGPDAMVSAALAAGVPVVMAAHLADDAGPAMTAAPEDVVETVTRLHADPTAWADAAAAGRRYAEEHLSLAAHAARLGPLLDR